METFFTLNLIFIWIVVLGNIFLTLAIIRKVNITSDLDMLKEGEKAPDFTIQSLDGNTSSLSNFIGNQLVLVFVSPGCKYCRKHMPELQDLQPRVRKAGVELLVISLADPVATRKYTEETNYTGSIFLELGDSAGNRFRDTYKLPGTPSFYLIDEQGRIKSGGMFDQKWKSLTKKLLRV